MRFNKKKVLALTGAIANLSFTCAVAGAATFAWFTSNNSAVSNNISIVTNNDFIRLDYSILKYDDNVKAGITAGINDSSEFVLPEYDRYIEEKNEFCNLVVKANLSFPDPIDTSITEIKIDITKSADSTLKALDEGDPNDPTDDAVKIRKLTSNVVQFKSIVANYTLANTNQETIIDIGIDNDDEDPDSQYRSANDFFASRKTPTTFISLMNGQPVDPLNGNVITLVPELYNVGIVKKATVYLECSYNEELVRGFAEDHPGEVLSNFLGDIERIDFGLHSFENSSFGEIATGKYVRMNNEGSSYNGQYIDSFVSSDSQQILDGSRATGSEETGTSTGINTNENQRNIGNYISTNKNTVYASLGIDNSSFTFDRSKGTYKSCNDFYVGNNTLTDGIISNADSTNLRNTLDFDGTDNLDAIVKPVSQDTMQLQYDSNDSKFAYYSTPKESIGLYRYHENSPIDATLTGITLTTPQNVVYALGEYFNTNDINVVAHYTRNSPANSGSFDINVTDICSYIMDETTELIPSYTSFDTTGEKTISVSYTDKGTEVHDSFTLTVIEDTLISFVITNEPAKVLYRVGEAFDISDLIVTGVFDIAGTVNVLPDEYNCKISGVTFENGDLLNIDGGNNIVVTIEYAGQAIVPNGFVFPTFTIDVVQYDLHINTELTSLDIGESATISFTFNSRVVWTISGTPGALSFSQSPTDTAASTTYDGTDYESLTRTITIHALADGLVTLTAELAGHTTFTDCLEITIGNPPPTVTFVAKQDVDMNATGVGANTPGTVTKLAIQMSCTKCHMAKSYDEYRFYKGSLLTISSTVHTIVGIEFILASSNGNPENLDLDETDTSGGIYNDLTAVWSGSASSVVFVLLEQVRALKVIVTYEEGATYTVSFNNNGGSGTMADVENVIGDYELPACTFTPPSGKIFSGWKAGNIGSLLLVGDTYDVTQDVTFYAQWVDPVTLAYNANGGSETMVDENSPYPSGATVTVLDNEFDPPSGKQFSHWNTSSDDLGTEYDPGDTFVITQNTTLYAIWEDESTGSGFVKVNSIHADDVVLIVSYYNNSTWYLLPSTTTSSAPAVMAITISNDTIDDSEDYEDYAFTVGGTTDNWTFTNPDGKTLYTTSNNNGLRIGNTSDSYKVTTTTNGFKMQDNTNSRYVGVYNGADWRSYNTSNASNYKGSGEYIQFFKKVGSSSPSSIQDNVNNLITQSNNLIQQKNNSSTIALTVEHHAFVTMGKRDEKDFYNSTVNVSNIKFNSALRKTITINQGKRIAIKFVMKGGAKYEFIKNV